MASGPNEKAKANVVPDGGQASKKEPPTAKKSTEKSDEASTKKTRRVNGPRGCSQTCHQCRQSIYSNKGVSEVKSGLGRLKCSKCTRFWCVQCLLNRYGIVRATADPASWICPFCNKNCNCSVCRRKEGKLATGILTPLVKNSGYQSVSDFLTNGTDDIAKCLQWKSPAGALTSETLSDRPSNLRLLQDQRSLYKSPPKRKRPRMNSFPGDLSTVTDACNFSDQSEEKTWLSHCRGARSTRSVAKRRCLSHSCYSITMEEEGGEGEGSSNDDGTITKPPTPASRARSQRRAKSTSRPPTKPRPFSVRRSARLQTGRAAAQTSRRVSSVSRDSSEDGSASDQTPSECSGSGHAHCSESPLPGTGGDVAVANGSPAMPAFGLGSPPEGDSTVVANLPSSLVQKDENPGTTCHAPSVDSSGSDSLLSESLVSEFSLDSEFSFLSDGIVMESSPSCSPQPEDEKQHDGIEVLGDYAENIDSESETSAPDSHSAVMGTWRSPRKRKQVQTYQAANFREHSRKRADDGCTKPPVLRERNAEPASRRARTAQSKPPPRTDPDFSLKRNELDSLLTEKLGMMRARKMDSKRQVSQHQAAERASKMEERRRKAQEKAEVREQMRTVKRETQELLRATRADAVAQRALAVGERERRRRELDELKLKGTKEKRRMKEAVIFAERDARVIDNVLDADDSLEGCRVSGVPDLPVCPVLGLPVTGGLLSRLLFVCEFLYGFSEPLKIRKRFTAGNFCTMLSNGRGLSDVYKRLLDVVCVEGGDGVRGEGRRGQTQRQLEQYAKSCLLQSGVNGFVVEGGASDGGGLADSLLLLDHLCHEALQSDVVGEFIEGRREEAEQVKREGRIRERELTKEISAQLKVLCEGGCSLEQLQTKRSQLVQGLADVRRSLELEKLESLSTLRVHSLGEDRYSQRYWHLQSVPGILLEPAGSCDPHLGSCDQQPSDCWRIVATESLLEELMDSLHSGGRREGRLHKALSLHRDTIVAAIKAASKKKS